MMTSHLPADLEEEILSRVPATSLMRWRSICRRWNTLFFKDRIFSEKHLRNAPKQPLVLMLTEYRLFFVSVDLKFVPPSIEFSDALNLKNYYVLEDAHIHSVSHCDGLLLCTTLDDELVVWNPCSGQTRWIRDNDGRWFFRDDSMFMLGYGNNQSCRSYKILRFYHINYYYDHDQDEVFEIYDLNSNTWRFLDARINANNCISKESHGVTLKGNAYWISSDNEEEGDLLSFDFTRERFRRFHFLPVTSQGCRYRALSVVREELSVLRWIDLSKMEMWVTNKMDITCEEADLSWTKSFTLDFCLCIYSSVLIDEDKKVALCDSPHREVAFTVGEEDEYYSEIPFEKARSRHEHIFNYVPSLVQFPQQSIESDGFGKYHRRRKLGHRRRVSDGTWDRDDLYLQGIDIDMICEEDDEWDWREIECTDFSSRRGSRGRGWTKTRCVTL